MNIAMDLPINANVTAAVNVDLSGWQGAFAVTAVSICVAVTVIAVKCL